MRKDNVKITIVHEGYKSLAKEVKEASHGGRVLLYTEEGLAGDDAMAALTFEGMRVTRRDIPEQGSESFYAELSKAPEGIMAVVAVGGVRPIEAAKAARIPSAIPEIYFPTENAALSATDDRICLGTRGALPVGCTPGQSVILDPAILSTTSLRHGLGYLLTMILEEADEAYERLLLHGESPANALRTLREKVTLLSEIREESAPSDTVNALLTLLKISPSPAALGSAHILALLAERKAGGIFPEHLFPASYALLRLYEAYLGALPLEHCPPPDRAENLRILSAKCSLASSLLIVGQKTYAEGYDERWRVTAEYREDFLETIRAIPLSHLAKIYRRAPKEERAVSLSASELLMLLSLTGEAVSGYPLIKHIKMTGLIEPLLKCG